MTLLDLPIESQTAHDSIYHLQPVPPLRQVTKYIGVPPMAGNISGGSFAKNMLNAVCSSIDSIVHESNVQSVYPQLHHFDRPIGDWTVIIPLFRIFGPRTCSSRKEAPTLPDAKRVGPLRKEANILAANKPNDHVLVSKTFAAACISRPVQAPHGPSLGRPTVQNEHV